MENNFRVAHPPTALDSSALAAVDLNFDLQGRTITNLHFYGGYGRPPWAVLLNNLRGPGSSPCLGRGDTPEAAFKDALRLETQILSKLAYEKTQRENRAAKIDISLDDLFS